MVDTEKARELFKTAFPFTEKATQYIAAYRNAKGKEIALERERTDAYYVWVQKYDTDIDGVMIQNVKNPGNPYDRKQPRNSNLNDTNAPNLKVGNAAWYLKVDDEAAVSKLVDWFKSR